MKVKLIGEVDLINNSRKYYGGEELEVKELKGFEPCYLYDLSISTFDLIPKVSCEIIERGIYLPEL